MSSLLIARPMPTFYVSHSRNTGNFNLWRSAFYAILWMNTDYSTLTGFYSDDFAWNKTWDQMKQSRSSGNIRLRFLLLQLLWCFLGHPSTVISIIFWKMSGWARKINVNYQNLRYRCRVNFRIWVAYLVTIQLLQLLLKSDSTSPFVERPIPF